LISLVLGAFALLLGMLAQPVIYDSLTKVELDQESVSISRGEGMSALRVSEAGPEPLQNVTLVSTRSVVGIPGVATGNNAFWQTTVESKVEDGPVLTYSDEGVSFDRTTAMSTNCCGDYIAVGDVEAPDEVATREPIQHDGLFFKFPFDTQKTDYPYWDGSVGRAVTADYSGEEKIEGVTAYKFVMVVGPEEVALSEGLPGALFGTDEPVDAARIYENTRTLWIEPNTGVILKGLEEQNVRFEPVDSSLPTLPITVGTIGYTDETVQNNAEEFGSKGAMLGFINGPLTWIGILTGLALLALGAFLVLGGDGRRREQAYAAHYDPDYDPAYDAEYVPEYQEPESDTERLTRRLHRERNSR
jgi:hypothetical protein